MGAAKSKPMREAPARFIAKQAPLKKETKPAEELFKKPEYTMHGINQRKDNVNTEPLMYVELEKDGNSTELTDHAAPRWYLNTFMELVDNAREDRTIISGNLPASWERDKNEPYALVRGRIDEEDLDWVLHTEQRNRPLDELLTHTKLDRQTLEDILATVELPRVQYRNYQGKLHKAVEDTESFLENRKRQMADARENEMLKDIGYSNEEIADDAQYRTKRSRGVRALDDLGVSLREKKRMDRAFERTDMERMLERRRIHEIEAGTYKVTEEDMQRDEKVALPSRWRGQMAMRSHAQRNMYRLDIGKDKEASDKIDWWLDRTRRIKRGTDKIYGVPIYNERLQANEEQQRVQMQEAAEFNFEMGKRQGAKGYIDPRGQYEEMMQLMRKRRDEKIDETGVDIIEDAETKDNLIFKFPHTKDHAKVPAADLRPTPKYEGAPSWDELKKDGTGPSAAIGSGSGAASADAGAAPTASAAATAAAEAAANSADVEVNFSNLRSAYPSSKPKAAAPPSGGDQK